jgi:hypothetical protein
MRLETKAIETTGNRGSAGETKTQSQRFVEIARAFGIDETNKEFQRALSKFTSQGSFASQSRK